MAFTTDTTTDIGRVRLLLRDQDEAKAAFLDSAIQVFLDLGGSVNAAVGLAARALLMERARFGRTSGDNPTIDADLVAYLESLVRMYGQDRQDAMPTVTVSHFARHPSDPVIL